MRLVSLRGTLLLILMETICLSGLRTETIVFAVEPPDLEWSRNYGGSQDDYMNAMVPTNDGGFVLCGYTFSFDSGSQTPWIVKTNSSGLTQWYRTYKVGYTFESLCATNDNCFVLVGSKGHWLLKVDNAGNQVWLKEYDRIGNDETTSVIQASDGGYILGGYQESPYRDCWFAKTDNYGNLQWNRTWGTQDHQEAITCLVKTNDGGFAFTAWSIDIDLVFPADPDCALVKIDTFGNVQWSRAFGSIGAEDHLSSIIQTPDGGYALAGYRRSSTYADQNFWMIKTDSSGVQEWSMNYGDSRHEAAHSMIATRDGGYMLVGYQSTSYSRHAWIVKTNSSGSLEWTKSFADSTLGFSVVENTKWEYFVGGNTGTGAGGMDFWLAKLEGDNAPPTINGPSREPSDAIQENQQVKVSVSVVDSMSGVDEVILEYSSNGGSAWTNLTMTRASGDTYVAVISGHPADTSIQFAIIAYDNAGNYAVLNNSGQYYKYTISRAWFAFPPSIEMIAVAVLIIVGLGLVSYFVFLGKKSRRKAI